jgi:hypothetical protein
MSQMVCLPVIEMGRTCKNLIILVSWLSHFIESPFPQISFFFLPMKMNHFHDYQVVEGSKKGYYHSFFFYGAMDSFK